MAETGLSWAEEKQIITYLKELLDGEALDYVVDRSQALAQKGSKYAAVDDEVWYLLVKRASAEWRTSKEFEGVTLPKKCQSITII